MEGHDVDLVVGLEIVRVHHERDMLEEARHVLELTHGAHELLEVVDPALCLRALVVLPHGGVARFIEDDLGKFRMRKT